MFLNDICISVFASSMFALRLLFCMPDFLRKLIRVKVSGVTLLIFLRVGLLYKCMYVYFVECMFVCVYSLTCYLRGPRGRLAMPNELPSINKDFHFTSLHFSKPDVYTHLSMTYTKSVLD